MSSPAFSVLEWIQSLRSASLWMYFGCTELGIQRFLAGPFIGPVTFSTVRDPRRLAQNPIIAKL